MDVEFFVRRGHGDVDPAAQRPPATVVSGRVPDGSGFRVSTKRLAADATDDDIAAAKATITHELES